MKAKLLGKNLDDIAPLLAEYGIDCTADGAYDFIVAHGGDGTLLSSEREYPGVPKLPIRDAATAPLCPDHAYALQLEKFRRGGTPLSVLPKIAGTVDGRSCFALNDIFLHTADLGRALRYRVRIDGELYANEIVGDGVGLSSVHGSTAYYRSITHSVFRVGLGLAFNNSTEEVSHLVLAESSLVEIEIVRGPASLVADNFRTPELIPDGGRVRLRQSSETADIYALQDFMCPKCRLLRHPNKLPFKGYF